MLQVIGIQYFHCAQPALGGKLSERHIWCELIMGRGLMEIFILLSWCVRQDYAKWYTKIKINLHFLMFELWERARTCTHHRHRRLWNFVERAGVSTPSVYQNQQQIFGERKQIWIKHVSWPVEQADRRLETNDTQLHHFIVSSQDVYGPITAVKDFGSFLVLLLGLGIKYLMHVKRRERRRARFLRLHLSPFIAQSGNQEDFFRASMKHWKGKLNWKSISGKSARDSPVIALLTCKAFQVINVASCSHHHLKRRDDFVASGTESCIAEQPQVISLAQH